MNVVFSTVKAIVETLPIAFYAKRRINMSCDAEAETSYYNPMKDAIVVAFNNVKTALKNEPDDLSEDKIEASIRGAVYHEVSHAILTHQDFAKIARNMVGENSFAPFNIFEDARIETILDNYYMNVDFRKNVLAINGFNSVADVPKAKDANTDFYSILRFHLGDDADLAQAQYIINQYCDLSRKDDYYDWRHYAKAIWAFYKRICSKWNENPYESAKKMSSGMNQGQGSENGQGQGSENGQGQGQGSENGQGQGQGSENGQGEKFSIPNNQKGNSLSKIISESFAPDYDSSMLTALNTIIASFNKKNSGGSAYSSYSGIINPKNVTNKDCRYFDRPTPVNGNNKFGTFHLNLFLDNSGSFEQNAPKVNAMLSALCEVAKRNKNFSIDVVHCGVGEKHVPISECALTCEDGTSLDYDAIQIFRSLQKPNTLNYNIVLYDGSCYNATYPDAFKAFNFDNVTIISDSSNKREMEKYASRAKLIYEDNNYSDKLFNHVVRALSRAFR